MVESKRWFEVDVQGMRELHGGRKPWHLTRELPSNVFDEDSATKCELTLRQVGELQAYLVCEDDAKGFRNVADAYTVLGHTYKRSEANKRGRFNLGEKEIIAVSTRAIIETVGRTIHFHGDGTRTDEVNARKRGTRIEVWLPWTEEQITKTLDHLKRIMPPKNISFIVNGDTIPYREPKKTFHAMLETVLLDRGYMRPTHRVCEVELHTPQTKRAMIYELGVPIQTINCPYDVNVLQKVPMNPNRDSVKDSYLEGVYAEVLNETINELPDTKASQTWVRQGIENYKVNPEVVKQVLTKRFGDKAVLWSTNTKANERASESGFTIIDPKTLSGEERDKFVEYGDLKHSSDIFPTSYKDADPVQPDEHMQKIAEYAKQLAKHLVNRDVTVDFFSMPESHLAACYGRSYGTLEFNVAVLGVDWFKQGICPETTQLIIHELGHQVGDPDFEHGPAYRRNVEKLAGQLSFLALKEPEIFK